MKKNHLLLGLIFLSQSCFGEEITLMKAYFEALKNNPNLKAFHHKTSISEEQINQALAPLYPSLTATATKNRYFKSNTTNSSYAPNPSTYDTQNYELKATQTLFNLPAYSNYSKAKISSKITDLEYATKTQELILEVSEVYFNLLLTQEKLEVAKMKQKTLEQQKADIEKRFELGDGTIQDLEDTKSKFYVAQSETIQSALNVDIAKAKFEEIVGIELQNVTDITPMKHSLSLDLEEHIELYIEEAYQSNLPLQIKHLNVLYTQKEKVTTQQEYYPKVDFVGSMSYYDTTDGKNSQAYHSNQNYVGIQLLASLYQGGTTTSKIKEIKERENQVLKELEGAKKELRFEIIKEYKGIQTTQAQIKSLEVALKSAKTTIEAAKIGFDLGTRTHYEVLQAIEQYYFIENSLNEVKYKYKIVELRLKMLVGKLDSDDLVD